MRLIDADALIDKAEKNWIWEEDEEGKTVPIIRYKDIVNAPTVDAEPIVRCKDCEFWGESQEGSCGAIDDPYMLHTDANDFCSWGKRRTDKVTEKE